MVFPEEKILGPIVVLSKIAFLREIVMELESPKFLTDVKPAFKVFSAFLVALIA